jgi:hypothetical protein
MEVKKNMTIGFQEVYDKTTVGRKNIRQAMDRGCIGPEERLSFYAGLGREDRAEVKETLDSLHLRELLAKSGALTTTAGLQGSNYLVSLKVFDLIASGVREYDLCPTIAARMIPKWDGADLVICVNKDRQLVSRDSSSGGSMADAGDEFSKITLTPTLITSSVDFGSDTLEDSGPDVLEYHIQHCGQAHGTRATAQAFQALINSNTGDGTLNTVAGGADETTWQQVQDACDENGRDQFKSNTVLTSNEAWGHTIQLGWTTVSGVTATSAGTGLCITTSLPAQDFDFKVQNLDILLDNSPLLHAAGDIAGAAFTDCKTLVFDRRNALAVCRKRWLQLERFSDPIKDLTSMVVTSRQACATLYDDSVCLITET